MVKNKIRKIDNKGFLLIIPALLLLIFLILFTGCTGSPKYTYEEYKKLKALDEKKGIETIDDDKNNNKNLSDSDVFYKDLDSYNNFISDFKAIYNNYSDLLTQLFDSFDNEQSDLDKKNQYAESIIINLQKWLEEVKEINTPELMIAHRDYFQKYLENEILFYKSFINGDIELLEKYQIEAANMYTSTEEELQRIEESFNSKALQLGIEQPFN